MDSREEPKRRRLGIDLSDLLLEIVSIVIAIIVATAVGEWRQSIREHAEVRLTLTRIRSELADNRTRLIHLRPLHRSIDGAFRILTERHNRDQHLTADAFGTAFEAVAPHGIQPFNGVDTAWQTARVSGTATHIDYQLLAHLENTYARQEFVNGYRDRLLRVFSVETTADHPNFYFVAANVRLDFNDLTTGEASLESDYDETIAAIDEAVGHDTGGRR